jgi:hypothetical protein
VSENPRRRNRGVLDFFDIRGAYSASRDLYQDFISVDFGNGDRFKAEIIRAAIDDRGHGFWNPEHPEHLPQRREGPKKETAEYTEHAEGRTKILQNLDLQTFDSLFPRVLRIRRFKPLQRYRPFSATMRSN